MPTGPHPSRAEIQASQLDQLRSLLTELFPANRFYTHKLQSVGVTFDVASLADFQRRFPLTTKLEIVEDQRQHPPFGTNLTYPLERYTRFHQTSGTTGTPIRWLDTAESWDWLLDCWTQVYQAAGVSASDRVYFAFSFGPFIGFWMAFESAARLGCLCLPGGGMTSAARVRAMLDNGATVLCATPTYAIRLAAIAAEEGIDLRGSRVKTIIVAGEPGGSVPATRALIEKLWPGARVFDHHGMTEVGPVTYECPRRSGVLHVIESSYIAEVLDPATGEIAAPGVAGELALSNLGRTGSPLLRYRTGDLVKCAARSATENVPCPCGRWELALDGGILGRADDMVIVRGVNVFPGAVEEIMRGFPEVAEYQVTVSQQRALAEMQIQIEPARDCAGAAALPGRLQQAFETSLSLRVPVEVVAPGSLPRSELKAQRWVRK